MLLFGAPMVASAQESAVHAELRDEGDRISNACGTFSLKSMPGCAYTLFTDHPFHIAAGSMPPQNGFGFGAAFVWSKNTKNWRMSWDTDAVGATSASWRAGVYMKLVHTPHPATNPIVVIIPGQKPSEERTHKPSKSFTHPYTVFDLYAQSISLNQLNYFGLGNDTSITAKSVFGMSETIVGGSAIKPVYEWAAIRGLHLALLGDVNGRFVDIRGSHGQLVPSIENLYTEATAPGLTKQPGFLQLGEGVRVKPVLGNFELNYLAKFQQFFAPSDSHYSFLRWAVDLNHTYYLYGYERSAPPSTETVGPDSCAGDKCPPIPYTRNLRGSIGVRVLLSESVYSATSVVPFYFQQTLGGQDINNVLALGSYQDYRFRTPNLLLFQETFEHSIWGPFGLKLMGDQGRVALTRRDLGFNDFKNSFAAGLTLRAGGFPMVTLMYAWGGPEGQHTIANMNTSLLSGSSRPSLY
ncbi:MAG TPA: hypothetical protein VEJ46_04500 [Candidatus Acidoferrum sp.]|nr:hypothetical protein [Candidatus Acidoferrum sp.]